MCAVTPSMSSCACWMVTPGFRRPITSSQWKSWFSCSGLKTSGTVSCPCCRSNNPACCTPTQLHPQLVGQDHDMVLPLHALFGQKVPTEQQRLAQHLQEARRRRCRVHVFRLIFCCDVETLPRPRVQILKGL